MNFNERVLEIILECGLEGLKIEEATDIFESNAKIFISVPATSAINTTAGEELAKKFKHLYFKAIEKEVGELYIELEKFITIYCKIRDEEWTEEKRANSLDELERLKQLSSSYQII